MRSFGSAIAGGLMLAASISLLHESQEIDSLKTTIGTALGIGLIMVGSRLFHSLGQNFNIADLPTADAVKMLMIVSIMTLHSIAEGISVGVSFAGEEGLGTLITAAIALHNIPEGLAIALVLIPRGISVLRAGFWAIFTSLPQPLLAVPAFLFVSIFQPFLPIGLGLAAGAMIWMTFEEMIPEANENLPTNQVATLVALSLVAMMLFQFMLESL